MASLITDKNFMSNVRQNVCPLFALLMSLTLATGTFASGASIPDFASPSGIIFQADARHVGDFARLTPSHTNRIGRAGGLWLEAKQAVRDGFETSFQFRITDKVRNGGDGFTFALQNSPTPSLGVSGSHLGFIRGGNSLVVKFDDYHSHRRRYVKYDEIAVTSCGGEQNPAELGDPLGTVTGEDLFSDGKIHTALVRYLPGKLLVFLDDLEKPLLKVSLKLESFLPAKDDRVWAGFTASTGDDSQNVDILNWSFNKPGESPAQPLSVANQSAGREVAAANIAPEKNKPEIIALPVVDGAAKPHQPHLGVPASVGLTHQVYASEDLVNWTLVTNLTLYFSDPNAPNYDHRFYKFSEK